jgi:hypothetical protein
VGARRLHKKVSEVLGDAAPKFSGVATSSEGTGAKAPRVMGVDMAPKFWGIIEKAPEVLGEHAGNFSCMFSVTIGNGATRKSPGYHFPKREACDLGLSVTTTRTRALQGLFSSAVKSSQERLHLL